MHGEQRARVRIQAAVEHVKMTSMVVRESAHAPRAQVTAAAAAYAAVWLQTTLEVCTVIKTTNHYFAHGASRKNEFSDVKNVRLHGQLGQALL